MGWVGRGPWGLRAVWVWAAQQAAPEGAVVAAAGVKAELVLRGDAATLKGATLWARALTGVLPTLAFVGLALVRLERSRPRGTVLAVVATLVATPLLSYGKLAYGHALCMALLYVGVSALIDAPKRTSRELWMLLGGLCSGLAVTVEYTAAFAGLPIAVFLVVRASRSERPGLSAAVVTDSALLAASLAVLARRGMVLLVWLPRRGSHHLHTGRGVPLLSTRWRLLPQPCLLRAVGCGGCVLCVLLCRLRWLRWRITDVI